MVAQKWLWWSDNGNFLNKNSSKFWCRFPVGGGNTNLPELFLLKFFCHYQTTTATSGTPPLILQLFHAAFVAWAAPFFTVWLFLCRLLCTQLLINRKFATQYNLYHSFSAQCSVINNFIIIPLATKIVFLKICFK